MNLFDFLRRRRGTPAQTAKERLQTLLAYERIDSAGPDYLPVLQKEIVAVVKRCLPFHVDRDKVQVRIERGNEVSLLEVDIELPGASVLSARHPPRAVAAAFAS